MALTFPFAAIVGQDEMPLAIQVVAVDPSIGGVLVPINTRMKGAEAAYVLEKSGARILFCAGNFLGTHYPSLIAAEHWPKTLEHVVVLRDEQAGRVRVVGGCVPNDQAPQGAQLADQLLIRRIEVHRLDAEHAFRGIEMGGEGRRPVRKPRPLRWPCNLVLRPPAPPWPCSSPAPASCGPTSA